MSAAASIHFTSSDKVTAEKIAEAAELPAGFDLSIATYRVSYMLCGMALELAYKAILVEGDEEPPVTHNLVTLAKAAGLTLSNKDESLLAIWSQLIIWDGKYPVPKKEKNLDIYNELVDKTLWDSIEGTPIKRMNNGIGWNSFMTFWNLAIQRYFIVCDQGRASI